MKEGLRELSSTQIEFVCKELGLSEEQLFAMTEEDIGEVYDKICDIEVDTTIEADDGELSERGRLAESIVTLLGNKIAVEDD